MNKKFFAVVLAAIVAGLALNIGVRAAGAPVRIKLGTLAPKGTSLHQSLLMMAEKWHAAAADVTVSIYPDGQMGGEAEMVKRMRVGQLQAAMLSATGLAEIDPSISAIQNMPMMFHSLDEVSYVRDKLRPTIEKKMREKGFVLLSLADAGWVRFFSKKTALHPADLKQMKMFTWAGSDDQVEILKSAGFHPVPLETADIYTSLQTGMIDAVPTIPIAALAGQFYGTCSHMLELNWAPLVGGIVVSAKAWDAMPAGAKNDFIKSAIETAEQITSKSRAEADEAVNAMRNKHRLAVHSVTSEIESEWRRLAEEFYPKIRGTVVPADQFDEVQRLLKERRATSGGR